MVPLFREMSGVLKRQRGIDFLLRGPHKSARLALLCQRNIFELPAKGDTGFPRIALCIKGETRGLLLFCHDFMTDPEGNS